MGSRSTSFLFFLFSPSTFHFSSPATESSRGGVRRTEAMGMLWDNDQDVARWSPASPNVKKKKSSGPLQELYPFLVFRLQFSGDGRSVQHPRNIGGVKIMGSDIGGWSLVSSGYRKINSRKAAGILLDVADQLSGASGFQKAAVLGFGLWPLLEFKVREWRSSKRRSQSTSPRVQNCGNTSCQGLNYTNGGSCRSSGTSPSFTQIWWW